MTTPLDIFFHDLEEEIGDQKELSRFMNAPKGALVTSYESISDEFTMLYWDSTYNLEINKYLDAKGITEDPNLRVPILLFAFQHYLKKEPINISVLAEETERYYEKVDYETSQKEKRFAQESNRIMEANNEKWKVGDTISIILPVQVDEYGKRSTFYYSYGYPITLDYSSADDSITVKGVLLNKRYQDLSESGQTAPDSLNIIFELKILKLSDKDTELMYEASEIGDTFNLYLKDYGREIQ